MLSNSIKGNLDILMISETKLDSTFPSNQFTIEGYAAPINEEEELFYTYGRIFQLDCSKLLYLKISKDFLLN